MKLLALALTTAEILALGAPKWDVNGNNITLHRESPKSGATVSMVTTDSGHTFFSVTDPELTNPSVCSGIEYVPVITHRTYSVAMELTYESGTCFMKPNQDTAAKLHEAAYSGYDIQVGGSYFETGLFYREAFDQLISIVNI
ncbi:hypothetical protein [Vibrio phage VCPH]|nr:hypothetical protein [Vibrio phage VCPH]